jgi:hypothetical protein
MHQLLALDARFRFPTTYEAFYAPHFLITEGTFKERLRSSMPRVRQSDQMAADLDFAQEDEYAIAALGGPSIYTLWSRGVVPSAEEWKWGVLTLDVENLPVAERQCWIDRWTYFLRCLLLRREGRLLLKSPTHTFRIPTLEALFPEAQYVYMVRDPRPAIASAIKAQSKLMPVGDDVLAAILEQFARLHERVERTRLGIPDHRLVTVKYEDLVADPLREVRRIYDRLHLGDSSRMEALVAAETEARSNYRPNQHAITPAFTDSIRTYCLAYAERHGYSLDAEG